VEISYEVADSEPSGDSLTSLNLFRAFSEIGGLEQALKDFLRPVYYKAEDIAPIVGMDHVLSKIGLRVARNGGSLSLWFNPEILYWAYFLPNDDEALLSSQRNLHRSTLKKLSLLAEGVFESEEIESLREEIAGYIYSQAQSGLLTQPGGLYDYIAYCSAMYLLPTAKLRDLLPKD
jgi:hypothetical protein